MDSQPPTNTIDAVLCEVLARHRGFRLEQSGRVNSVWFGRIRRDHDHQSELMADLDVDVRDALYAHHMQLRSSKISRDRMDLQVAAPEQP